MNLVYFTSASCEPCKKFLPIVQEVAAEHDIHLEVVSIDDLDGGSRAASLGVQSVPRVYVYEDSNIVNVLGVTSKKSLSALLS